MGQSTRSLGISFTHEMWTWIAERSRDLKVGRSQYFQMLVERDMRYLPETHAHKADGKWHFYPESEHGGAQPLLKAAEEPEPAPEQKAPRKAKAPRK